MIYRKQQSNFTLKELMQIASLASGAVEEEKGNVETDSNLVKIYQSIDDKATKLVGEIKMQTRKTAMQPPSPRRPHVPRPRLHDTLLRCGVSLADVDHINRENVCELYDEVRNEGEFYAMTRKARTGLATAFMAIGHKWSYWEQVIIFRDCIELRQSKQNKSYNKALSTAAAKLFVDYYLDELELGNVIY